MMLQKKRTSLQIPNRDSKSNVIKDLKEGIINEVIDNIPVVNWINGIKGSYDESKYKRNTEHRFSEHDKRISVLEKENNFNNRKKDEYIEDKFSDYDKKLENLERKRDSLESKILEELQDAYKYYKLGNYRKSKEILVRVTSIQPNNTMAHYMRGLCNKELNSLEHAKYNFTKAIETEAELKEAYYIRSELYLASNNIREALNDYNSVIDIDEDFECVHYNRGIAHSLLGNIDEAIEDFTKSINQNKNVISSHYNRAGMYISKGKYNEAIDDLNEVIRLNPEHINSYYTRGIARSELEKYDEAIKDFKFAIHKISNNLHVKIELNRAYYNRGLRYMDKKLYEKALRDLNAFLKDIDEDIYKFKTMLYTNNLELDIDLIMYYDAFYNRGIIYMINKKYIEAINNFDISIELYSNCLGSHSLRGEAYIDLGLLEGNEEYFNKALSDFEKTIKINPNFSNGYCNIAYIYACLLNKNYEYALRCIKKAIELEPENEKAKEFKVEIEILLKNEL